MESFETTWGRGLVFYFILEGALPLWLSLLVEGQNAFKEIVAFQHGFNLRVLLRLVDGFNDVGFSQTQQNSPLLCLKKKVVVRE